MRLVALCIFSRARGLSVASSSLLRRAVETLRSAGVPEAEASAEWLLAHAVGSTTRYVPSEISAEQRSLFEAYVARRAKREPTQYIVGRWAFHGVEVTVRPPTLVPRPETEELVERIIEWWGDRPARFVDICCGTGCIALALRETLPGSSCLAFDIDDAAVSLATENAAGRFPVLRRSAEEPRPPTEPPYDFVVSNPPYIPTAELATLDPEVALFEDRAALDGGEDGLDVVRSILEHAPTYLDPDSARTVWLELDVSHPKKLLEDRRTLVPDGVLLDTFDDLFGNPRFARLVFPKHLCGVGGR
ncbi:hypothetical protein CTAYLR_005946 [Chrysophaeum taylorii]|uniref:peptide chain release factor N(5)-glutamine methyltransferase n=1 Tax=Chrysophaeum taylorii TaxID=2483200 RepID=A0AAD7UAR5_9STRA|nr:hypothetical protein CTAYLR_005946 [Chrysophaeum taylorii]